MISSTESPRSRKYSAIVIGGLGREPAHHRALVAGRDDRDRRGLVGAERIVEEFAHLAAAFAHQRDDHGVEIGRLGEHREQRGLADARSGENADALARAQGGEEIDDPDPALDRILDARAAHRGRRLGVERHGAVAVLERRPAVDRAPEGVDDPALPVRMRRQRQILGAEGAGADAGVASGVEGLQRDVAALDAHDLAELGAAVDVEGDAFAELEEARQSGDAIMRTSRLRSPRRRRAPARRFLRPQATRLRGDRGRSMSQSAGPFHLTKPAGSAGGAERLDRVRQRGLRFRDRRARCRRRRASRRSSWSSRGSD